MKHASSKVASLPPQTSDLVFEDEYKLLEQQEVNLALLSLKKLIVIAICYFIKIQM